MITLVLGGARSGKSVVAERLAARSGGPVTYLATLHVADDEDLALRVAAHRERRPAAWSTIECGEDLARELARLEGVVLVDSLGPWLASLVDFTVDTDAFIDALAHRDGDTIIVSEEVGLGVHPTTPVGRRFRDELGVLNQVVARLADEVLLVVAGRVLPLANGPA